MAKSADLADPVRGGKWATRDLFALDADVTVYWPDVRPCYEGQAHSTRLDRGGRPCLRTPI